MSYISEKTANANVASFMEDILHNMTNAAMLYEPSYNLFRRSSLIVQTRKTIYYLNNYSSYWILEIFDNIPKERGQFSFIADNSWKLYEDNINAIFSKIEDKYSMSITEFSLGQIEYKT
jgi:hypothetical protein